MNCFSHREREAVYSWLCALCEVLTKWEARGLAGRLARLHAHPPLHIFIWCVNPQTGLAGESEERVTRDHRCHPVPLSFTLFYFFSKFDKDRMELKNKHFEESSVNEAKLWRSGSAGAGWDVEELVATRTCHKSTVAYYAMTLVYIKMKFTIWRFRVRWASSVLRNKCQFYALPIQ